MISTTGHGWIVPLLCVGCAILGKFTSLQTWMYTNFFVGAVIYFWGRQENHGQIFPPHTVAGMRVESAGVILMLIPVGLFLLAQFLFLQT